MASVIFDGMTQKAFITGKHGQYDDCRFEYRPVRNKWLTAYRTVIGKIKDPLESEERSVVMVAERLTAWDLVYPDGALGRDGVDLSGKAVPFLGAEITVAGKKTREEVGLWYDVHPQLATRIVNIVLGYAASDPDPTDSDKDQDKSREDSEMGMEALISAMADKEFERQKN